MVCREGHRRGPNPTLRRASLHATLGRIQKQIALLPTTAFVEPRTRTARRAGPDARTAPAKTDVGTSVAGVVGGVITLHRLPCLIGMAVGRRARRAGRAS